MIERKNWRMWSTSLTAALALTFAGTACDAGGTSAPDGPKGPAPVPAPTPEPEPEPSAEWIEIAGVTSLQGLPEDSTPVGITVDPQQGKQFVLTEEAGLYELSEQGLRLVYDTRPLRELDAGPALPFTDVTALSTRRFALTAKNEGYLLDTDAQTLDLFFCYLPDEPVEDTTEPSISQLLEAQGIEVFQITRAVAHDPVLGLLYAQPLTVGVEDGVVYGSEIGMFSDLTGEPLDWRQLDGEFEAEGLVVLGEQLILARGSELYQFDFGRSPVLRGSLAEHGVGEIAGLARIPDTDRFLVLDRTGRQILEVELH